MERHIIRKSAFASLLVAGSAMTMLAQPSMNRGPNPNAPKLMVSACRTTDKALAVLCADKLRTQIEGDVSFRVLYVNPKTDVENVLSASGYDPAVALAPADAMALAKQIHADMYIDATVEKTSSGFKVAAAAVLSRDASMVQPLGVFENAKIEQVAAMASRSFREVFEKSFDDTKTCFTAARERKTAEAQKAIAAVMKDYPKSVWIRQCNYQLLKDTRSAKAEVLKAAEDLSTVTPEDKKLLRELVIMYSEGGNKEKQLEFLRKLYAADPNDAKLCGETIGSLAGLSKTDEAFDLAQKCASQFQGDIPIIQNYWLLLLFKNQNKTALTVGKQMVMLDSSLADTTYYIRTIGAASSDSNWKAAAESAEEAAVKFPKLQYNGNALYTVASLLWKRAGNDAASLAASRKALAADPNAKNVRFGIANAAIAGEKPDFDAAKGIVKEMQAAKEDPAQIASVAVSIGNRMRTFNGADSVKLRGGDDAAVRAALLHNYEVASWADSISTPVAAVAPTGKFIMGVGAYYLAQNFVADVSALSNKVREDILAIKPPNAAKQKAIMDAQSPAVCAAVQKVADYLLIAQAAIPAGGRFAPQAAQQIMGGIMQQNPWVEQVKKGFSCK
jgi:tetratricopeptide (TPR) repeat protein